jgi:hypothetical protein
MPGVFTFNDSPAPPRFCVRAFAVDEAEAGKIFQRRQADVFADGHLDDQPFRAAIFRNEINAVVNRVARD